MEKLKYETPSIERKEDALDYIKEHYKYNSNINGSGGIQKYLDDYEGWLKKLEEDYNTIPNEEKVPKITYFLVRENDNKIVGMINIRLILNDKLKKLGGHIGYGIRPSERGKGYNKINLYLGLKVLQKYGIKDAMLSCNKDNLASWKTIVSLGGKLVNEFYDDEQYNAIMQNYMIDVDKSLNDYKEIYEPYVSKFNKLK